jgi:quercetin dioxygenase-like cupin family protein
MNEVEWIAAGAASWSPHPAFPGVRLARLLRALPIRALDGALVEISDGASVPEHAHAEEDDILYVLRGEARMWIEGRGEQALGAGDFLRIPRGRRHRPFAFAGGFLAFNLWAAAATRATPERSLR